MVYEYFCGILRFLSRAHIDVHMEMNTEELVFAARLKIKDSNYEHIKETFEKKSHKKGQAGNKRTRVFSNIENKGGSKYKEIKDKYERKLY